MSSCTPVVVTAGAGYQEARLPPGLVPGEPAHGGGRLSPHQLPLGEPGPAQQVSPGRQLPPQPQPRLGVRPPSTQVAPRHFGWGESYCQSVLSSCRLLGGNDIHFSRVTLSLSLSLSLCKVSHF